MRPSKHPSHAITMMREMLDCGIAAGCYTDEEILFKVNDMLAPHEHICTRTFRRYKAAAVAYGQLEVELQQRFDPIYQGIYTAIQRSQIELKETLINTMLEAPSAKSKDYKWILERKFPEFNLRIVNKRFLEREAEEKRMLEEDLAEAHEAAKLPKPVPSEKPYHQQIFEREIEEELLETVEEQETAEFTQYLQTVKQEWDTANPLQPGHVFDNDLQNRMVTHYRHAMKRWKERGAEGEKSAVA